MFESCWARLHGFFISGSSLPRVGAAAVNHIVNSAA